MPLAPGDGEFRYSAPLAVAGNLDEHRGGQFSLGKYVSRTPIVSGALHNVFGPIEPIDTLNSAMEYACLFVTNIGQSTLFDASIWLTNPYGGDTLAIANDNFLASDIGSSAQQATSIADGRTAPAAEGISDFVSPISQETGLPIGDVGPGQVKAIWVRRTAPQILTLSELGVRIRLAGVSL